MKTQSQKRSPIKASYLKPDSRRRRNPQFRTLNLRRILVPLDFSGQSRQALAFAVPLAQQYGGQIFLLHVVEPIYAFPPYPGEMGVAALNTRPIANAAMEKLCALATRLIPAEVRGRPMVRTGRAYHEIICAAKALKVDLIALSTHGHTGLKHVFLGSTAENVVRQASCPVLTLRRH